MLKFLYETAFGRMLLKPLTSRAFSELVGFLMNSRPSRLLIPSFVRKNSIDMSEYVPMDFSNFNEFFTRKILPQARPTDMAENHLMSPCDGNLSVYRITEGSRFSVKHSVYDVAALTGDANAARMFAGGICMVFRLCVNNYHRFHYFDDGGELSHRYMSGVLHTVRPIALENTDVFIQNCRECTWMQTRHFGLAAQIEVGAMLVGRIQNHHPKTFRRGDEKGMFLYGGSTVILLLQKDRVAVPQVYFNATARGEELPVRFGQWLGDIGES